MNQEQMEAEATAYAEGISKAAYAKAYQRRLIELKATNTTESPIESDGVDEALDEFLGPPPPLVPDEDDRFDELLATRSASE